MEIDRLQFQVKQSVKHQQSILNTLAGAPHNDLGGKFSQTFIFTPNNLLLRT